MACGCDAGEAWYHGSEESDAWWVLEPIPGYVRVTLPQESLVMPVDQIRRFASQLVMAANAAGTGIAPPDEEGK